MAAEKPVLTYFGIRGRAEPIRLALADLGVEYENDIIPRADWAERKAKGMADGSLCFGQIPQYRDAQVCMVQMNAILRHIGRTHNAYGETEADKARIDMIMDAVEDARLQYGDLIYKDGLAPEKLAEYATLIVEPSMRRGGALVNIDRVLAQRDCAFVAGDKPSVADYVLLDLVDNILRIVPDALAKTDRLARWHAAMHERPNIKAYIASAPSWRAQVNGVALG